MKNLDVFKEKKKIQKNYDLELVLNNLSGSIGELVSALEIIFMREYYREEFPDVTDRELDFILSDNTGEIYERYCNFSNKPPSYINEIIFDAFIYFNPTEYIDDEELGYFDYLIRMVSNSGYRDDMPVFINPGIQTMFPELMDNTGLVKVNNQTVWLTELYKTRCSSNE